MDETLPVSRVSWTLELLPDGIVHAVCVNDVMQDQRLSLDLPTDSIPALYRALRELLDAYADRFPTVLRERSTNGDSSSS